MTKFKQQIENIRARARRAGFELRYWNSGHEHHLYPESEPDGVNVFLELREHDSALVHYELQVNSERVSNRWGAHKLAQIHKQFEPLADCALVELHADDMAAKCDPDVQEKVMWAVERYGI